MESFLTAARAVYPMLAMILTGMLVRKLGIVTDGGLREMNRLVYTVFLPALMFVNVMDSDFSAGVDWAFFVWPLVMIGVVFIVLMLAFGCVYGVVLLAGKLVIHLLRWLFSLL